LLCSKAETEADVIGVQIMSRACYDPTGGLINSSWLLPGFVSKALLACKLKKLTWLAGSLAPKADRRHGSERVGG
jgi:hypothetical protein